MPWIETLRPSERLAKLTASARPRQSGEWYRIRNLAHDEAEILLYGEIGWLGTEAEQFVRDLREVTARRLTARISSPGGSVFDGIAIANALRAHPAQVTVQVDGIAASIASVIAMAGDKVIMMPHSQIMVHDANGLCVGNAADMEEMRDLLDRQSDNIAQVYADRAGGEVADWRQVMRAETWYSAQEAVDAGLADEVMPSRRRDEEREDEPEHEVPMAAKWDLSVFRYAGRDKAPPPKPVAAKPTPPPQRPAAEPAQAMPLTTSIGAAVGEQLVAAIRNAVATPVPDASQPTVTATPQTPDVTDTAVGPHSTAVKDGTWDASAEQKKLPSPMPVATARKMYTTYDEDSVEDGKLPKGACHLPHHFVSADGSPGAASMSGVRNALSRLPQTHGLSEAEKATAERHLRAHLKTGGGGGEDRAHPGGQAAQPVQIELKLDGMSLADAITAAVRQGMPDGAAGVWAAAEDPPAAEPEPVAEPEAEPEVAVPPEPDVAEPAPEQPPAPDPAAPAEPDPETVDEPEDPDGDPEADPAPEVAESAGPTDAWAAAVAHLTSPEPDDWRSLIAHLAAPPTSPSADDEFERLKEALL